MEKVRGTKEVLRPQTSIDDQWPPGDMSVSIS